MKMRTARRMHKTAMTTRGIDDDCEGVKVLKITRSFRSWIRGNYPTMEKAKNVSPSPKLAKILGGIK